MKPRTKIQKKVAALSERLPKRLTEDQLRYAIEHCFHHYAWRRASGRMVCSDCGETFDDYQYVEGLSDREKVTCPICRATLTVEHTSKRTFRTRSYYLVTAKRGDMTVFRMFMIDKDCKAGRKAEYSYFEAVQNWIEDSGRETVVALPRCNNNYYYDLWARGGDLQIRSNKSRWGYDNEYHFHAAAVYPRGSVSDILKRNGWRNRATSCCPATLAVSLLTDVKAETLAKTGQYALLDRYVTNQADIEEYWPSVRICLRHGYIVQDASIWRDMVAAMDELGYDIRNPRYVCPEDLHAMHNLMLERKRKRDERRDEMDRRKTIAKYEENYRKQKGRYFGLSLVDGDITVQPLKSVAEFADEGVAMHHCVFEMGYYKNPHSLILSAHIAGKRIETVEFSLKTLRVLQSRGVCNSTTPYHDRIIALVESNADKIRKLMPRRKANERRPANG